MDLKQRAGNRKAQLWLRRGEYAAYEPDQEDELVGMALVPVLVVLHQGFQEGSCEWTVTVHDPFVIDSQTQNVSLREVMLPQALNHAIQK